jgi:hypothetical protein
MCLMIGQPRIQISRSVMGFQEETPSDKLMLGWQCAKATGETNQDRLLPKGGDEQLPNDVENPGRGTAMHTDGRDNRRRRHSEIDLTMVVRLCSHIHLLKPRQAIT